MSEELDELIESEPSKLNGQAFPTSRIYDYFSNILDYETFDELSNAINSARLALFDATDKLNTVDRKSRIAKTEYERRWRRAYLSSNEKTDFAKRTYADIVCEEYEDDYLVKEQVVKEMGRICNVLRLELQTLQTVSNNLRQQLRL